MSATCQLDDLSRDAGHGVPASERALELRTRSLTFLRKAFTPWIILRKARFILRHRLPPARVVPALPRLGLQAGERVRVKSLDEIKRTLDEYGACARCHFVEASMAEYCGTTQTVLRRVEHFYDERARRMCTAKNMVALEGVHCRGVPAAGFDEGWRGCDRMCFLFWKEAWLERV
jgi:hypothetical protein